MSLLDGGPRSATIVAETPVRLLVISRRNFSVLLTDVPGLTQSLLMTLSQRVRKAEESAERMGGQWQIQMTNVTSCSVTIGDSRRWPGVTWWRSEWLSPTV
jgi:CRP-like cAMP-binding protein